MEIKRRVSTPRPAPKPLVSFEGKTSYREREIELQFNAFCELLTIKALGNDLTSGIITLCTGKRREESMSFLEPFLRTICEEFLERCAAMEEV